VAGASLARPHSNPTSRSPEYGVLRATRRNPEPFAVRRDRRTPRMPQWIRPTTQDRADHAGPGRPRRTGPTTQDHADHAGPCRPRRTMPTTQDHADSTGQQGEPTRTWRATHAGMPSSSRQPWRRLVIAALLDRPHGLVPFGDDGRCAPVLLPAVVEVPSVRSCHGVEVGPHTLHLSRHRFRRAYGRRTDEPGRPCGAGQHRPGRRAGGDAPSWSRHQNAGRRFEAWPAGSVTVSNDTPTTVLCCCAGHDEGLSRVKAGR